ncbi:MAG: LacI family DNA-binding transcriptional regulator [Anaerolineae bacterium]|nr:LacI family DNA-binding transcriptional regulator [Anaerolineae bacterium]
MTRVTIKEIAQKTGLSIATVSRVVNNHPDVSKQTRRRVQQVIDELDYAPNAVARSLIQGRSKILGVVSTGIEYYGPSQTMAGIERQANELGYWLMSSLLHDPETNVGEDALRHLLAQQVDGIIWAVPEVGRNREWIYHHSHQLAVPIVFLHMNCRDDLFVVAVDNFAGAQLATRHLLAQGYTRIGCVSGPDHWWEAQERERGWRDTLVAAGTAVDERLLQTGDWTAAGGFAAFLRLAEENPDLEAAFVSNDQMALGVLKAAHQLGKRVPDDLAVVGFDDIPEAAYYIPSLTTIHHDVTDVGAQAVQLLDRILSTPEDEQPPTPTANWIVPELVVRDSSVTGGSQRKCE